MCHWFLIKLVMKIFKGFSWILKWLLRPFKSSIFWGFYSNNLNCLWRIECLWRKSISCGFKKDLRKLCEAFRCKVIRIIWIGCKFYGEQYIRYSCGSLSDQKFFFSVDNMLIVFYGTSNVWNSIKNHSVFQKLPNRYSFKS